MANSLWLDGLRFANLARSPNTLGSPAQGEIGFLPTRHTGASEVVTPKA
jgi:hypothetical protein